MKKITFILFALIAGTTFAQTTVNSTAEIIEAITFTEISSLNFGKVDNTAGTVIISAAGGLSGSKPQVNGATTSAAELTISGSPSEAYTITVPLTTSLSDGTTSLNVTDINPLSTTGTLDGSGEDTVNIGGTLTLDGGEDAGTYSGTISVTLSYN